MFVAALSPAGSEPATHYVSTGKIDAQFAPLLLDGSALHAAATSAGVDCTLAECEALVAESDVSDEEPFVAFARLGLRLMAD